MSMEKIRFEKVTGKNWEDFIQFHLKISPKDTGMLLMKQKAEEGTFNTRLAYHENEVIGYLFYAQHLVLNGCELFPERKRNDYYIGYIVIDERYQKNGIGKKLVQSGLNPSGPTYVSLPTPEIVPYFEKLGFEMMTDGKMIYAGK